jgi:hypothetical protein
MHTTETLWMVDTHKRYSDMEQYARTHTENNETLEVTSKYEGHE